MSKKGTRDRLVRIWKAHPDWMLVWEDVCWFSRFAQPTLNAWTLRGKAVALEQREWHKEDEEGKAVTCYDALEEKLDRFYCALALDNPIVAILYPKLRANESNPFALSLSKGVIRPSLILGLVHLNHQFKGLRLALHCLTY